MSHQMTAGTRHGNLPELTAGRTAGDDRVQLTGYSA